MSIPVRVIVDDKNNSYIEALLWKPADGADGNKIWAWDNATRIRVYFEDGTEDALKWTADEKAAFERAIRTWEAVANIQFEIVTDPGLANLVEQKHHASDFSRSTVLGNHEVISSNGVDQSDTQLVGRFNIDNPRWSGAITEGSLFYRTLFHEIGHGIGLAHPHDTGGGSGTFPGPSIIDRLIELFVGGDQGELGANELNHSLFTVMSYNRNYTFDANGNIDLIGGSSLTGHTNDGYMATPGAFDIAAIQAIYGANPNTGAGDTTYTLSDSDGPWRTIWDTSGTDEIAYRGDKNARFDLRAATLDNTPTGGGGLNYVSHVYAGLTIAHGVTIENVTGGRGNDKIIGNSADNRIKGGRGNDVIRAGDGIDTAIYNSPCVEYKVTKNADGSITVAHIGGLKSDGVDTLFAVEKLQFANETMEVSDIAALTTCGALDIVFVQDLSGSFGDDIATVRAQAPAVAASLAAAGASVRFAVTSFVDLPFSPYGGTGDYTYRVDAGFTTSPSSVGTTYNGLRIYFGGDWPEAQLVALNQVARGNGLAFRPSAHKVAIVFTDASAHIGSPHVDVATVRAALEANDVVPIFAVTSSETSFYSSLVSQLGRGGVVTLSSDSSNITDAISQALGNLFGAATIPSTSGSDTITGTTGLDRVYAGLGNDLVSLGAGEDYADGGTGNDRIDGGSGDDIMLGGTGDDTLTGGSDADIMAGGLGNDTYNVDSLVDRVIERANEGTDTIVSSVSYVLAPNFENLELTGSAPISGTGNARNNTINGATNSGPNLLKGLAGNDTYIVGDGDTPVEAMGGGTDTVAAAVTWTLGANLENLELRGNAPVTGTGNGAANVLDGSANSAANSLFGRGGNDTYIVGPGDTVVELANAGIDTVMSAATFALPDFTERLVLTGSASINGSGNSLANVLIGNSGANLLDGGTGGDSMRGGLGNDTYVVDSAADVVIEDPFEGIDTVNSSVGYALGADVENLVLTGGGNIGGRGNALVNSIIGNTGDNTISGRGGNDTLTGGLGLDKFIFDTTLNSFLNVDRITDFSVAEDSIMLDDQAFAGVGALGTLGVANFRVGAAAGDASDRIIYNSTTGALFFDPDGTGSRAQTQFAVLGAGLGLTNQDFVVI